MKKINTILVTLLLLITLVACNKTKVTASVKISNIEHDLKAITFDIDLEDEVEQLEGRLIVSLENIKDEFFSEKRLDRDEEKSELTSIRFSGLKPNTTYKIKVDGTVEGKPVNLHSGNISTQATETKEINTVDEFFEVSTRYSKYILKNDLDFSDIDSKRKITTFNGEFDGNGHTIKNYDFTNNTTYSGLFGTLSSGAKVHNLKIDNMNVSLTSDLTSNRSAGILFGRSTYESVEVKDITITNSTITYDIDSSGTRSNIYVGLLGGDARGSFENIEIDDSNKINLSVNKYINLYVGGLFGNTREDVKGSKINNGGEINITIKQDGKDVKTIAENKKIEDNIHLMYVGGLVGENNTNKITSAITSTNINVNEENLYASYETKNTTFQTYIGGVYGRSLYPIEEVLYKGNIDLKTNEANVTENPDEEKGNTNETNIRRAYHVGGISGRYTGYFEKFNHVVRSNSKITVTTNKDYEIEINVGTLLGSQSYIPGDNPEELESFKVHGDIVDKLDNEIIEVNTQVITNLADYFQNEWIRELVK